MATLTFPNQDTPMDLLLWAVYKRQVPGLVEATYAANPGFAELDFWPPFNTKITVTPPPKTARVPAPVLRLY